MHFLVTPVDAIEMRLISPLKLNSHFTVVERSHKSSNLVSTSFAIFVEVIMKKLLFFTGKKSNF